MSQCVYFQNGHRGGMALRALTRKAMSTLSGGVHRIGSIHAFQLVI
jgi:hypothetical protein